jgi:hypothetical protein
MIKFVSRPNIIYLVQLIIWNVLRKIEKTIISEVFDFGSSTIFSLLMFIGEFLAGLILARYQNKFLNTRSSTLTNTSTRTTINLIQNQNEITRPDNVFILYILLFITAFYDFVEFTLSVSYLGKFYNISGSLESRLGGILTISAALFFYFLLKFQIFKHQFFSLLTIGICLILVIISEFIFQEIDIFLSYGKFVGALFIIFLIHFFNSLLDSIEKYLFEYDYFNPFKTLMWEGFFGTIITLIYCFIDNYFNKLVIYYNNKSTGKFVGLIFLARGFVDTGNRLTNLYNPIFAHFDFPIAVVAFILLVLVICNILISARNAEKEFKVVKHNINETNFSKENVRKAHHSKRHDDFAYVEKRPNVRHNHQKPNRPRHDSQGEPKVTFKNQINQESGINRSSKNIRFESNDLLDDYKK